MVYLHTYQDTQMERSTYKSHLITYTGKIEQSVPYPMIVTI